MENRIKTVENEINEDGDGDDDGEGDVDDDGDSPLEKNATLVELNPKDNAEEGLVNIGEMKAIAGTFASEKQLIQNNQSQDGDAAIVGAQSVYAASKDK